MLTTLAIWFLATLAGTAFIGLPFLAAVDRSR